MISRSLIAVAQGVAWFALAGVIMYAAANPTSGVLYDNPGICAAAALVGVGLCMEHRKRKPRPTPTR